MTIHDINAATSNIRSLQRMLDDERRKHGAPLLILVRNETHFSALVDAFSQYVENCREALALEHDPIVAARLSEVEMDAMLLSSVLVGLAERIRDAPEKKT